MADDAILDTQADPAPPSAPATGAQAVLDNATLQLAALEKPGHDLDAATGALVQAQYTGDPDKIAAAQAALDNTQAAYDAAKISPRAIAIAAQAVIDAREALGAA